MSSPRLFFPSFYPYSEISVALCAYSPLPLGSPALSLLPRLPDREGGREGGGKKSKVTKRERETLRGMRDAVCVRVEMGGERARWEMWH